MNTPYHRDIINYVESKQEILVCIEAPDKYKHGVGVKRDKCMVQYTVYIEYQAGGVCT